MNILFSTGHPAQIHNFRVVREQLIARGHNVYWLATKKDISENLLTVYGIEYTMLHRPQKGALSKIAILIKNALITAKVIKKNKIDIVVSRLNPSVALAAFLMRKKQIGMSDTEAAGIYDYLSAQLVNAMITATSFEKQLCKEHIRINASIELYYLHPNYFNYDLNEVYKLLNIPFGQKYVIIRFVGGSAFHDEGHLRISEHNKLKLVQDISNYARVFVSSEDELNDELLQYKIEIPYEKMHMALAGATLFFGEGASMASESVICGTPAIYVNDLWAGSTNEEQKAGLLFSYKTDAISQNEAINKALELINKPEIKKEMVQKRDEYLKDKIDPVAFFVWFIENFPESKQIMLENPDYQYNFR